MSNAPTSNPRPESSLTDQIRTDAPPLEQPLEEQTPRRKYAIFLTTMPLLLHALSVIATACFMLIYVRNRNFGTKHRDRYDDVVDATRGGTTKAPFFRRWTPLQTDIVTILSVLIVIARFFLINWCADVAWKLMFILLEKPGLSLLQIRDLIKYKVLLSTRLPSKNRPEGLWQFYLLAWVILFLPFPAHFSAPIITGSITWTPSSELFISAPLDGVTAFANNRHWTRYQNNSVARYEVISLAGVYYNIFYSSARDSSMKRSLTAAIPRALASGSTIANITMPEISLSNLTWIHDTNQIPSEIISALHPSTGRLNATEFGEFYESGSLALIPGSSWQKAGLGRSGITEDAFPRFADPPKKLLNQTLYLAFWPRFADADQRCDDPSNDYPPLLIPNTISWYLHDGVCYSFATVNVLAGARNCENCRIEQSQIVTSNWEMSNGTDEGQRQPPVEDVLVDEVLWLMPQAMDVIIPSAIFLPSETGLDDYVKNMIRRAYAATWSALTDRTSDTNTNLSANVTAAVISTRAVVNLPRVIIWIAFQSLPLVGACIFGIVQHNRKRPLTADTIMAAMFLDHDDKLQQKSRDSGMSEVVVVSSERHHRGLGLLRLRVNAETRRSQLMQWDPEKADGETQQRPAKPKRATSQSTTGSSSESTRK